MKRIHFTSAEIAKSRLMMVVRERREGGRWDWLGEAKSRKRLGAGGPVIETYRNLFRWVTLQ